MTAFRGPFDPHRQFLDWEMDRWVEEKYYHHLPAEVRREIRRPKSTGLGGVLNLFAPLIAVGVVMLNSYVILTFFR